MAATRLIAIHAGKGKSISSSLSASTDYIKDPDKTEDGKYISCYACDPQTVDAEFMLSKQQYELSTGRTQKNDVIAYQFRQSFRPREILPDEANQIGCEFADRWLKGQFAYIVSTHTDKAHIHNHIIYNSTSLDGTKKFRDFMGSGMAARQLSDLICIEHGLSVIENPERKGQPYNKWAGTERKLSHRDVLRAALDEALKQKPQSFDALLHRMEQMGYEIKRGRNPSMRGHDQKRFIRLDTIPGYDRCSLEKAIEEKKPITTRKPELDFLIDIQAKIRAGKGPGYVRWAKNFNLKQYSRSVNYLMTHNLLSSQSLAKAIENGFTKQAALQASVKSLEAKLKDNASLQSQIVNYFKTKPVFEEYKKSGYSKKFLEAHQQELLIHRAAKADFNERGLKQLPTISHLRADYSTILSEKHKQAAQLKDATTELHDLLKAQKNIQLLQEKEAASDRAQDKETR